MSTALHGARHKMEAEKNKLAGKRVLVVDDDAAIVQLLSDIFVYFQATVKTASTGSQMLEMIKEESFDLIILDLRLPDMCGWNILQQMEQSQPEIAERIILLTGDQYNFDTQKFIKNTHYNVVLKPFEIDALRNLAERISCSFGPGHPPQEDSPTPSKAA